MLHIQRYISEPVINVEKSYRNMMMTRSSEAVESRQRKWRFQSDWFASKEQVHVPGWLPFLKTNKQRNCIWLAIAKLHQSSAMRHARLLHNTLTVDRSHYGYTNWKSLATGIFHSRMYYARCLCSKGARKWFSLRFFILIVICCLTDGWFCCMKWWMSTLPRCRSFPTPSSVSPD